MATRSKAKAASASSSRDAAPASAKRTRGADSKTKADQASHKQHHDNNEEKENIKAKSAKPTAKRGKGKAVALPKDVYCKCSQGDDGSPMVRCGECKIWYHFVCVDLSEPDAEDISVYICPSCTATTGRRTAMTWEGSDAFEDVQEGPSSKPDAKPIPVPPRPKPAPTKKPLSDDSEDLSSEDEYVAEVSPKGRGKSPWSKRRRSVPHSGSESDSSQSPHRSRKRRLTKVSASPAPVKGKEIKRKASTSEIHAPVKRKKTEDYSGATEDPTRKYCLGKLEELFRDIFFRYPHVRTGEVDVQPSEAQPQITPKPVDEMTAEENDALTQESKQFALELEKCIFEIYAEPDKNGNPHAAGNYKERFRSLQFNLSKPDRVVIHQRITSANISPKELTLMSSTDLANEETQQIIKIAEQEALEHSILQKQTAPRAKITHKGLQDIEVIDEASASNAPDLEVQRQREAEAEERRDRERMARLKSAQRQRTASLSIPESPTISHTPTSENWGAPPPVPSHIQSPVNDGDNVASTPSAIPLFIRTGSDIARYTPEPELSLADLINIDEEPSPSTEAQPNASVSTSTPGEQRMDVYSPAQADLSSPGYQASPTGLSPFAAPQEKPSFNLSTLWSASRDQDEESPMANIPTTSSPPPLSPPTIKEDLKDSLVEPPTTEETNDHDFDMFLEEDNHPETTDIGPKPAVSLEDIPQVWTGRISMPLDSTTPQETLMIARQVAGPSLDPESPLWKTLFPNDHLRIDGRVPVDNSVQYLLQMRMNSAKELYAAAFTPATEGDEAGFKALSDFLTAKGRHGLVFPWGSRPKEYHPGRELYVIPLSPSEPLPEYMELLDNLKLPKERQRLHLIGIWVLNKGKLAPLPTPPTPAATHIQSPINLPATGTPPPLPPFVPPMSAQPQRPPSASATPSLPFTAAAGLPPGIDPSALAAEVASLTPEQIQNVIRTLQMSNTTLPVLPQPQSSQVPMPPNLPPFPPHAQHAMPPHQPIWPAAASTPPYPMQYPPTYPPIHTPTHDSPRSTPSHEPFQDRPRDYNYQGDRDNRGGWRSRGRGRGSSNWDRSQRDNQPNRPVDSGWPRRHRSSTSEQSYDASGRR